MYLAIAIVIAAAWLFAAFNTRADEYNQRTPSAIRTAWAVTAVAVFVDLLHLITGAIAHTH